MNKSDKDKLDGLLKVADFSIARFDQRRNHSWKVSLGFWAAILGSATLLDAKVWAISLCPQILVACLVLILHTYWLVKVFDADKEDKTLAFKARDIAIRLLKTELKPPPFTIENRVLLQDWSFWFQFFTTLLLLIAILFIVNV